ncbi:PAS domain S-box protein [Paenibacillus sp. HN-1]|uniref:PAS domain S-box protein n=1 Tax=Paenibacillus TaxID=44249 RepID=UPI001CA8E279|nr:MULTISPECIES: PAS domain S-box protein [Paenibacillus]MBY9080246.1 PAS domain S-box protein [Paenibacillus sp. CGMCC 1.18879]MBY9083095.1 PAS domain S-box protein [Paenibacillus sinensis]
MPTQTVLHSAIYILIILMALYIVRLYMKQSRTARHMLELERKYSEELQLYLNVVEQSPLSIVITDKFGKVEYINPYFSKITGYSRAEMEGGSLSVLRSSVTTDEQYRKMWSAISGGGKWEGEFINRKKNGELYTESVLISPIKDKTGSITHYVGIKENISDYKKIRKELSDQLHFTSQLIDTLPHPLFYLNTEGYFLGCNAAYEEALGVTRSELLGLHARDLPNLSRENYLILNELRKEVTQNDAPAIREVKRPYTDGTVHDLLYSLSAYQMSDNTEGGYLGLMMDITDLKLKEKELLESRNFLDAVINLLPVMVFVKDALTMEYRIVNQACADFLGYPAEQILGRVDRDLMPEEIARRFNETDRKVLETGHKTAEIRILPVDTDGNQLRYVNETKLPIMDSENRPHFILGVSEDITGLKLKEEEIKQALRIAEEATAAKSQFLANMSHEIRTPMNAILGLTHLTLKTELSVKQKDYLSKIHNAGTSLLGIVNEILDFSKIEAGKLELEHTSFELQETVTDAVTMSSQTAYDKGLELMYFIPAGLPQNLTGDPLRLRQILTNLVSNAVKFTESGEVVVRVEAVRLIDSKVKLKFSIRDSGIGLSPEAENRLFQPFSQADNSTTRKYGGTGLGLTISRRLVEMMGGTLWAENNAEGGSMFAFTAWFGVGDEEKSQARRVPEELGYLKALVVDDNPAARDMVVEYLRDFGCAAYGVSSGSQAVEVLVQANDNKPYDMVFIDWELKEEYGSQAARRIKEHRTLRHIPVIVLMTAIGQDDAFLLEEEAVSYDECLVKPVNQSLLFDMIIDLFAARKGAVQGAEVLEKDYRLKGLRVLVAEDNEINQLIAAELLKSQGVKTEIASTGEEAVRKSLEAPSGYYHLVLMDMQMPVMDGVEAARRIRESDPELPIIAMTARTMPEEREKILLTGMNDHIAKPIDPDVLFTIMGKWMAGRWNPEAGRPVPPDSLSLQQPEAPEKPGLPELEGIRTEEGLRRTGGNAVLYASLLRNYADHHGEAAEGIRAAIREDAYGEAHRIAHNLKGVSGNIGAAEAGELAGEIVAMISSGQAKSRREELEAVIDRLEAAIGGVLKAIRLVKPDAGASAVGAAEARDNMAQDNRAPDAAGPDAGAPIAGAPIVGVPGNGDAASGGDGDNSRMQPPVEQAVSRLLALLRDSDIEAVDVFDTVEPQLRLWMKPEDWRQAKRAIALFDFDEAIKTIERAAADSHLEWKEDPYA